MTNARAAPTASAAHITIDMIAIDQAITCLSECPQNGNLHDRANQVGGSVVGPLAEKGETDVSSSVSTVTSTDRGVSGGSGKHCVCASCVLLSGWGECRTGGIGVVHAPRAHTLHHTDTADRHAILTTHAH